MNLTSQKLTIQIYDLENFIISGAFSLFDEALKKLLKVILELKSFTI